MSSSPRQKSEIENIEFRDDNWHPIGKKHFQKKIALLPVGHHEYS